MIRIDFLVRKHNHDLKVKEIALKQQETKLEAQKNDIEMEKLKITGKKEEQEQKLNSAKSLIAHRAAIQNEVAKNRMELKEEQKKKEESSFTRKLHHFVQTGPQATFLTPQQAHCTSTNGGTFPTDFQGAAAFAQGIASYDGHQFSLSPTSRMPEITPSTGSKRNSTFLAPKNVPPPSSSAKKSRTKPPITVNITTNLRQDTLTQCWGRSTTNYESEHDEEEPESQVESSRPDMVASRPASRPARQIPFSYVNTDGVIEFLSSSDDDDDQDD